eukprot:COSAG01_NODE_4786_length_4745_cov_95.210073_2_plen_38_part_00
MILRGGGQKIDDFGSDNHAASARFFVYAHKVIYFLIS